MLVYVDTPFNHPLKVTLYSLIKQIWMKSTISLHQCCNEASKIFKASKIFVRRSIFVFIFGSFSDAEESSKLRRFLAKDSKILWENLITFWTKLSLTLFRSGGYYTLSLLFHRIRQFLVQKIMKPYSP